MVPNVLVDTVMLATGAGSGLGRAFALAAAEGGASLSLVDVNMQALEETKALVQEKFPDTQMLLIEADVTQEEQVKAYVDKTMERYGVIHGFYNNAGIEGRQSPLSEYDSDIFSRVLDVNVKGVFYGLKYVLKVMREQQFGSIVNVASVGGIRAVHNQSAYVASKHAVAGLTKCASIEYGQYNINVNAIAPGVILTDMVEGAFRQMGGENWRDSMSDFVGVNPKKRFGQPAEVAAIVVFLLSKESEFVSGTIIPVDGGQSSQY